MSYITFAGLALMLLQYVAIADSGFTRPLYHLSYTPLLSLVTSYAETDSQPDGDADPHREGERPGHPMIGQKFD